MYYYSLKDIFQIEGEHPFSDWNHIWNGISDYGQECLYNLKYPEAEQTTVNILLTPLINRWVNDRIALCASDEEINFSHNAKREAAVALILKKLNLIIPKYKELYARYNSMLTAINNGLTTETIVEGESRHNDTPNADNDYSAEKYTSDVSSSKSTSKIVNSKLDDYDAIKARIENLPQQIISEMKEFEIWMN